MTGYKTRLFWLYFRRSMWIFVSWVLISNFIFFIEYFSLVNDSYLTSDYDFKSAFTANMIVAVSAALIGGFLTLHVMTYWLRKYAFWKALTLLITTFTIVSIIVGNLGAAYKRSQEYGVSMLHPDVLEETTLFITSWVFIKNFLIWMFIVVATLIVIMVNDKYGPGVFLDYLRGRYFRPKREKRIFMFADIKDATVIAEKLGEAKYFELLKSFFRDITPAILQTKGEVYQYVGDEVVVSWKLQTDLKSHNALSCYFTMVDDILSKKQHYLDAFGLVPEFKVGFHYGPVMVGELGQIKRDIAFSGDVLNTTARIQASCNQLGTKILASSAFGDINSPLPEGISMESLGPQMLKGKSEAVEVVTFRYEN